MVDHIMDLPNDHHRYMFHHSHNHRTHRMMDSNFSNHNYHHAIHLDKRISSNFHHLQRNHHDHILMHNFLNYMLPLSIHRDKYITYLHARTHTHTHIYISLLLTSLESGVRGKGMKAVSNRTTIFIPSIYKDKK
jgi:hypothetical protein